MTEIDFLPVCKNCRAIIKQEVNCIDKYIYPQKCENCGEYFERIVMPIKLPFKEGFFFE